MPVKLRGDLICARLSGMLSSKTAASLSEQEGSACYQQLLELNIYTVYNNKGLLS